MYKKKLKKVIESTSRKLKLPKSKITEICIKNSELSEIDKTLENLTIFKNNNFSKNKLT